MLRSLIGIPLLCLALAIELIIAILLVDSNGYLATIALDVPHYAILGVHVIASLLAAVCISALLVNLVPGQRLYFTLFLFLTSALMPFLGAAGAWLSIAFGAIMARHRHKENVFWQFTDNADLPFAAPINRAHPRLDGRGFIEQLTFDNDTEALYNKVVASRHIRDSQSAPILKSAVGHSNERIRLVAYQMLDKKVNTLNKEIQRLESEAKSASGVGKSNIHLQIANNYWELLTLEGDEPVARQQLLESAAQHASSAIEVQPGSVNANFLLGQIALKQGDMTRATGAFEQAEKLGMPKDKVIPYIAEAAYTTRDFKSLRKILAKLDPAFKSYPPLSNVVEYWA